MQRHTATDVHAAWSRWNRHPRPLVAYATRLPSARRECGTYSVIVVDDVVVAES